jgi:hypothetical protein
MASRLETLCGKLVCGNSEKSYLVLRFSLEPLLIEVCVKSPSCCGS